MKLSTLVSRLQALQAQHGDVDIEDIFSSLHNGVPSTLNILTHKATNRGRWLRVILTEETQ
jgi:hypothetical protein